MKYSIFTFGILIACLIYNIVLGVTLGKKFKTIENNMTYEQVISIIRREPEQIITSGDDMTCVWHVRILRGWTINVTIGFKKDRVVFIIKA